MDRKVILDDVIPARHGKAYEVKKGQVLQIYLVEDMQVGDCVFFNAHDYKEWWHLGQTWTLSNHLGTGTAKSFKHFYSKPPRENVMLTVVEDTVKWHSGNLAARCSRRSLELRDRGSQDRSCQENLEEALAPYGLVGDDIGDIFNIFMNTELDPDGSYTYHRSRGMKGDHVDFLAEMDVLAAMSCCPSDSIINDFRPKPMGVKILE